jgi:hypothetical protein
MTGITSAMARTKKRPPRKRRSDFEGRTKVVTLKLSDEEYAAIAAAVDKLNARRESSAAGSGTVTVSSWIRDHAIAPLGR